MKKRTKKRILRTVSGGLAALFIIGIGILGLAGLSSLHAKACDFTLDEGIAWGQNGLYYMPAEVISEGDWQAFRGSNGMVYEWSERVSEDSEYLLTMDSKDTKEWYDDEILVVWRVNK